MQKENLKMHFKNILFDFDGTIADTNKGIVATVQETMRLMHMPIPEASEICKTIGLPLDDCFRIAAKVEECRVKEASALYRNIFMDIALDSISLFEGVSESLAQLQSNGITMAISSSRNLCSLLPLVEHLEVGPYFSHIYGEDESIRPKPYPDLALKILKELSLDPNNTLVVGDTIYDLKMGKSAGCSVCGVTFGNHSRTQLATEDPQFLIDKFNQIVEIALQ